MASPALPFPSWLHIALDGLQGYSHLIAGQFEPSQTVQEGEAQLATTDHASVYVMSTESSSIGTYREGSERDVHACDVSMMNEGL